MRKEYKMTQDQYDEILDACKPTPVMYLSGGTPMFKSSQENANHAWELLGDKLGFDYITVEPYGSDRKWFTAVPKGVEEQEDAKPEELYYLQDSRDYVGNDVLWWAINGAGYTTDLNKAEVWTREKASNQYKARETDLPWPKFYIDSKSRPAVDHQYIDRKVAMSGKDKFGK